MGFSSAVTVAAQEAFRTADKPVILANHALRDATKTVEKWNTAGTVAAADATVANARGEIHRVYDGFAHQGLHSRPDAVQTTWYLVFDLNTTPIEFDSMVLHGSNLYLGSGATITLQIADSADFATNLTSIVAITPGANQFRFVDLALDDTGGGDSRLYSNVEYLRIKFEFTDARIPRIRELWLGKRTQMEFLPDAPWDADRQLSTAPHATTKSGVISTSRMQRSRAARDVSLTLTTASQQAAFDDIWDDSLEGTEPFYWVETPGSDPKAYLMRLIGQPNYNPVLIDGINRLLAWSLHEQNPFLALDPS